MIILTRACLLCGAILIGGPDEIHLPWDIRRIPSTGSLRLATHGDYIYGHELGMLLHKARCDEPTFYLTISSMSPWHEGLLDQPVAMTILADGKEFTRKVPFVSTVTLTKATHIAILAGTPFGDELAMAMMASDNVKIRFDGPEEFVKSLDYPYETFPVRGFSQALLDALDRCHVVERAS